MYRHHDNTREQFTVFTNSLILLILATLSAVHIFYLFRVPATILIYLAEACKNTTGQNQYCGYFVN